MGGEIISESGGGIIPLQGGAIIPELGGGFLRNQQVEPRRSINGPRFVAGIQRRRRSDDSILVVDATRQSIDT